MGTDGAAAWDARYAATPLVWSAEPNRWVEEVFSGLPVGAALDLGAGEGRHAIWLARRGWRVTAVDYSGEAVRKAAAIQEQYAPETRNRIIWVHADAVAEPPAPRSFDAVLLMYLHLPAGQRRALLRAGAEAVRPSGTLLLVGHDRCNLTEGTGGPREPAVLFTADDLLEDLDGLTGLEVRRAERVERTIPGTDDVALDTLLVIVREA